MARSCWCRSSSPQATRARYAPSTSRPSGAPATLQLPLEVNTPDGSLGGRGLPNYLAGIAADPANGIAWVVAKKDNILRGQLRDGQALTFETTVRAIVSRLDLNQGQEQLSRRARSRQHEPALGDHAE